MKRRDFIRKSGLVLGGTTLASCGLFGCAKKEEPETQEVQAPEVEPEMSKMDMMKKHMMEDMGMSEAEVTAKMAEMKEKLPDVKAKCICATCPSYVEGETELGFCHLMVGKSDKITERKGCDCPQCPVYKMMEMEFGYYCIQGSEMELKMAKA
ncbi:DUF2769 domain-containing protein [Candidatus Zixiibacteriota bacterium]